MRGLMSEPTTSKQTGTAIRWRPDLEVFTDISIDREDGADNEKAGDSK